jgi:hypothetical protein
MVFSSPMRPCSFLEDYLSIDDERSIFSYSREIRELNISLRMGQAKLNIKKEIAVCPSMDLKNFKGEWNGPFRNTR